MTNTTTKVRFYLTSSGRSPVEEFLHAESTDIQEDFSAIMSFLENGIMLSMPQSRSLSSIYSGLHELRLKDRHGQVRIFYFIKRAGLIFMLHAMHKKTQQTPRREIDIALKRIKEILYAVEDSHSS